MTSHSNEISATILAIESSCDETSAAIVRDGRISSLIISSQLDHHDWGGVVPELASRAHLAAIARIVAKTLEKAACRMEDIDAVAVTVEPGLIGSLLVGLNTAKGIAVGLGRPLIAVNHLEAHLFSVLIDHDDVEFPYLGLVVSGGHTLLYHVRGVGDYDLLGATRDDAAGEAFDKGAKLLGLGYPGGPDIDRLAREGNPEAHRFPRALLNDPTDDFSFSGLKTSLRYYLRDHFPGAVPEGQTLRDLCASYQAAIVDTLVARTIRAAGRTGVSGIAVVGGVSVNSALRRRMGEEARALGLRLYLVEPVYSTDNAAMIGIIGWHKYREGATDPLSTVARASMIRSPRGRKGRRREPSSETDTRSR